MPYLFRSACIDVCYNYLGSLLREQLSCGSSHTLARPGDYCNLRRKLARGAAVVFGVMIALHACAPDPPASLDLHLRVYIVAQGWKEPLGLAARV